jgi:peptide-methionine (S)-S-oxide reductase
MVQATEIAVLGGGCFWCLEAIFNQLQGVQNVKSGYCGGHLPNPTYEQVCTGTTGHAEVVRVEFKPSEISFTNLLEVFFAIHDPTTLNRQGEDVGTQYRSVVFYQNEQQKQDVENLVRQLDAKSTYADPIVTQVEPSQNFYAAEDYHEQYFARNPNQGYCRVVVGPKVQKFKKQFSSKLQQN